MKFTLLLSHSNFLSKPLFWLLLFSKFIPALHASNNTPCIGIYYWAVSLRIIVYFWFLILSYGIYRGPIQKVYRMIRVFSKPPTNRPPTTDRLPTNQPTTNHWPRRSPTKCTKNRPTDHRPTKNMRTRNFIINFKWISDKKCEACYKYNIEILSNTFLLKSECVIENAKSWKVKLISVKHIIQKLHLNKKDKDRWKLCRNYKTSRRLSIQQMWVARL